MYACASPPCAGARALIKGHHSKRGINAPLPGGAIGSMQAVQFRRDLWEALASDNADDLTQCLQGYSHAQGQDLPGFLANTSLTMWNPNNSTQKGLLEACCCNIRGVPHAGCPDCARAVVDIIINDIHNNAGVNTNRWGEWKFWAAQRLENLDANVSAERQWVHELLDSIPL